jgi:hypothetical protein
MGPVMQRPIVTEISRPSPAPAAAAPKPSQRDLVAQSMRAKPAAGGASTPALERDHPRGIFR